MSTSKPSWLTTLIMYPTLIVALFSGLPKLYDFYQSYKLGLPVSKLHIALEQRKLWEKNITCLLEKETYQIKVPDQTIIEATLCPSGDVLFRHLQPDGTSIYLWLGYESFKKTSWFSTFTTIASAEVVQTEIIPFNSKHCITLHEEYLFWEKNIPHSCYFEKIRMYTGDSILVRKINCNDSCD